MKARSDAVFVLFLLLLAVSYLSFLTKNELILCGPQQFFLDHPIRFVWVSHFFVGNLPWITNVISGGIPLWADPNLAIFYPGNVVYLVLPLDHAWNFLLIFHLLWGGAGVYWLCRELPLPVPACLIGAFTFLFSSPALAALGSSEVLITASWMPWIFGLLYSGLQRGVRRMGLASVAFACQWLAGFTFIQGFTLLLAVLTFAVVYWRTKDRIVFFRFLLILTGTLLLTAIQWIPALLWLPHSNAELGLALPGWKLLPYFGVISAALFIIGLRDRVVWCALIVILLDGLLFGGSPIFAICLALGAAKGGAYLFQKFRWPALKLVPALIVLELLAANWQVPRLLSLSQISRIPTEVTQIPDLRQWNLHCSAKRSALFSLAGLHWGVSYGTPPDNGLMIWKQLPARRKKVEEAIQTGKNLDLLREAAIGYVISDRLFHHPELRLIDPKTTRFFVQRLNTPIYPLAKPRNEQAKVQLLEVAPHHLIIETMSAGPIDLTIHRNALPGWECRIQNKSLRIQKLEEGWMKIQIPAGNHQTHLIYRTPGSWIGTILTALGTLLILAVLLL